MDIRQAFPSNYIKASDLQGNVARVRIKSVAEETIGTDTKPVIYFEGKQKGLVLNRTNGEAIASEFGYDTDNWPGGEIELFSMKVPFNGQQVDAVRVRVPRQKPAQGTSVRVAPNARDRAAMAQAPAGNEPPPYEELDDEIPF